MTGLRATALGASLGGSRIIRDVDLDLGPGEIVGLIGPNGAGKTTLVRALAHLIPFEGEVTFAGHPLAALGRVERARRMAYLAQTEEAHWPLNVEQVVMLGRLPHLSPFSEPQAADRDAVARAMALADIAAFRERDVTTLSGGERARVMLARALAVEADILLVDEPTAALDPYHQIGIMEVLKTYARKGRAVIAILHDLTLAARYCDRLVLLNEGRVHAEGPPAAVLSPANLRAVYRVTGRALGDGAVLPWEQVEAG